MRCSHAVDDKELLRTGVLRARKQIRAPSLATAGHALAAHAPALVARGRTIAAYAGVGTEPPTQPLLEALVALQARVLLPVVRGTDLDWAVFTSWSELRPGSLGLLEPSGVCLGGHAAASAVVVLVPALAVDRRGHRLGRGGGFYDRWLPRVPPSCRIAVVHDAEVLATVPHERHDQRVGGLLTPRRGLVLFDQ